MDTRILKYALAFCGMLWALALPARQVAETGYPFFRNYEAREYRAHGQNFALAQDRRGVTYVGNFAGVLEYDGAQWRLITTRLVRRVLALMSDSTGRVYVGANGEFGYLAPDPSTGLMGFVSISDNMPENQRNFSNIFAILQAPEGIYFVSDQYLFLYDGQQVKSQSATSSFVSAFYSKHLGKLVLVDRAEGLLAGSLGSLKPVSGGMAFGIGIGLSTLLDLPNGQVLLASEGRGLYRMEQQGAKVVPHALPSSELLERLRISAGMVLPNGYVALGTERGGLVILDVKGEVYTLLNRNMGLQNEYVHALMLGRDNELWLALNNGVSVVHALSPFTFLNEETGLKGGVLDVQRHQGHLYFATYQGLFRLGEHGMVPVDGINAACWSIASTPNGLLAATTKGLFEIAGESAKVLTSEFAMYLLASAKYPGRVYVGHVQGLGLMEFERGKWVRKGEVPGISHEVRDLVEDANGMLWCADANKGVMRLKPADTPEAFSLQVYDSLRGLPANHGNTVSRVGGQAVVSTFEGLYLLDAKQDTMRPAHILNAKEAYPDASAWFGKMVEDPRGHLWITKGDQTGLMVQRLVGKGRYKAERELFQPMADLVNWAIYPDHDGIIWMGGPEGAIRFDANRFTNNPEAHLPLLRRVSIGKDSVIFNGTFQDQDGRIAEAQREGEGVWLDHANNAIAFEFATPSYHLKEAIYYQYMLENFDKTWSEWTEEGKKEYTNLPAGDYAFRVRSRNVYGRISLAASYRFSVGTPWYQRLWFWAICALATAGLLYAIVRWRSLRLLREQKRLERLIDERTEEIRLQKEEIEVQSVHLSSKNEELERIGQMVKSINSEISFNRLLEAVLEKTASIRAVSVASALIFSDAEGLFRFRASVGRSVAGGLERYGFDQQQAAQVFLEDTEEVFEDIYLKNTFHNGYWIEGAEPPHSALVLAMRADDQLEGLFVLENFSGLYEFSSSELSLINNLKEHIKAAFIKSNILLEVEKEKDRSEGLLRNILPATIAEELKTSGAASPRFFDHVTVLFTDFKGFTQIAEKTTPEALIETLNECFLAFDEICDRYHLEKIKTIGDAYMAAGGIPEPNGTHALDAVRVALEMQAFMAQWKEERLAKGLLAWDCRIGINTGPVVAGVIGKRKFAYDIWGDAVNIAARMESSGEIGKVNISGATYEQVADYFRCTHRGKIEAKNKGEVDMYFVEGWK